MLVRWLVMGGWLMVVVGLGLAPVTRTEAEGAPAWEALGPPDTPVDELFTPTSGALLARTKDHLLRSDDGGLAWRTIEWPADTDIVTVSPTDHDLLYAAGRGGVHRSEDGGGAWTRVSDSADTWKQIAVSPADPSVLYGVTTISTKNASVETITHAFRSSHDGGATWEVTASYDEKRAAGSYPCGYTYRRIVPHGVAPERVLTIEGCVVRGDPRPQMSADEGRTSTSFPDLGYFEWGAYAAVGGQGANPGRWYVSSYRSNVTYTRVHHSKLMRTDDDGASWTAVFDESSGEPYKERKPVDFIREVTYNARQPDDVFAVFERYELQKDPNQELSQAGSTVRMSPDAGATWQDLGMPDAPSVTRLAVGVDGRYLFAATPRGVYRLALAP